MAGLSASGTSPSLLERVRQSPADQPAWTEFVERYAPRIYKWCQHWRLQDADAREVTQIVLTKLVEKLRNFVYDPAHSFRAWLKTVTHHAWQDYVDSCRRFTAEGGSGTANVLHSIAARDDLVGRFEDEFDREVLQEAMRRIRQRIEERTWDAFRLAGLEGVDGKTVSAQLNMPVTAVYMAKSRVQAMLKEELKRLNEA